MGSEDAARLSRRLGGFPLALDTAGSSLAQPTSEIRSFAGYAQALTTQFEELLATESPNADDPDAARRLIRYTWELSLDQLAAAGHARPTNTPTPLPVRRRTDPRLLLTAGLVNDATGTPTTTAVVDGALAGLYRCGLLDARA